MTGNLKASIQVNLKPVTSVGSKWKEIEHLMREGSLKLRGKLKCREVINTGKE